MIISGDKPWEGSLILGIEILHLKMVQVELACNLSAIE